MTDLQKAQELFDSFGIGYNILRLSDEINMSFRAKEDKNVEGYTGFEATLIFSLQGKAIKMDIIE